MLFVIQPKRDLNIVSIILLFLSIAAMMARPRSIAGQSRDPGRIEYSCNECGEEFEIFRDLAKHKRAAQCREEEFEELVPQEMGEISTVLDMSNSVSIQYSRYTLQMSLNI